MVNLVETMVQRVPFDSRTLTDKVVFSILWGCLLQDKPYKSSKQLSSTQCSFDKLA